jgi:hypothetical protein
MTKRQARKAIREIADQLNARHEPGLNVCSAERAYGTVQRQLRDSGADLSMDERLELMAYAHGYVTATTGVEEPRGHNLDAYRDAHDAGRKAGSR